MAAVGDVEHDAERQPPDAPPIETPVQTVVRVSRDGNDGGDGFTQPVATLRRAIELANQHHDIAEIELNPLLVHAEGQGVTIVDALVVGRT